MLDGPAGSQKACLPVSRAKVIASFSKLFLEGDFFSIFGDLGAILGGFGKPKWK